MIETRWNASYIATVLGWVFIVVGILGFIPNPLVYQNGVFEVNGLHNIAHLLTGAILVGAPYYNAQITTIRVIAVAYAILAIAGFIAPSIATLGGAIAMNHADHWLHLLLAAVLLFVGFARPMDERVTTAPM